VNGGVAGEFGMEGGGEDPAALDKHRLTFMFCQNGDAFPDFFDDGCADEDHFDGSIGESGWLREDIAGELAAVAVAQDGHIEKLERILGGIFDVIREKNGACASAEDGVVFREFADRVVEALFLEELELGGGFAAREDERVAGVEVGDGADFDGLGAEFTKPDGVCGEVALDGEDADFGFGSKEHSVC